LKSELEQTGRSITLEQPWRHGLATTAAFVIAGAIPLLVYVLPIHDGMRRFQAALVLSLLSLSALGAARSSFTNRSPWRGAAEMVVIAGGAAAAAYGLGFVVEPLLR
jgi:VIT1/CCC1 family predicted Fe2+/Mn2+ transporter